MADPQPMTCPYCGATMNHHADKLIQQPGGVASDDIIEQVYACPRCGASASRRAGPLAAGG